MVISKTKYTKLFLLFDFLAFYNNFCCISIYSFITNALYINLTATTITIKRKYINVLKFFSVREFVTFELYPFIGIAFIIFCKSNSISYRSVRLES